MLIIIDSKLPINTVTRPKKPSDSSPPPTHNPTNTVTHSSTNLKLDTNNANNANNNSNNNNFTTRDFTGIYSVLFEGYVPPPQTLINWDTMSAGSGTMLDKSGFFPVYRSSQRTTCLEICGWGFSGHNSLEAALQK